MNHAKTLLSACAIALFGGAAGAATITVENQFAGSVFGTNGHESGTLIRTGSKNINGEFGGFALKTASLGKFVAWCLDITTFLNLPATYTATDTPFAGTSGSISQARLGNIQKLFDTAYATLDLTSDKHSSGFQIALWEILYETGSSLNTLNGAFKLAGDVKTIGATGFANTLLANLGTAKSQTYALTFLESGKNRHGQQMSQNLVTASPVPLPAAGLMLLSVMGGIAALARIKRRA